MAQKLDTGSDNYGKTNHTSRSGGFAEFRPIPGSFVGGGPDALVRCPTQCTLADAWPSEPTPRGAAPRRRSPPRSHRRIRLLTAARLTAAARPTTTKLRGSQRITRKRTSCPRDGPQPSPAAACDAVPGGPRLDASLQSIARSPPPHGDVLAQQGPGRQSGAASCMSDRAPGGATIDQMTERGRDLVQTASPVHEEFAPTMCSAARAMIWA